MSFPFEVYFRSVFAVPFATVVSVSVILICVLISTARNILRKNETIKSVYGAVVMLMIAAFFLWKNILPLAEGGIYLGKERAEDAVMLRGNIEEITELNANTHPKLSQPNDSYEEIYGVRFTIDGVSCIGISKGELEVGDYVEAMYLPKSGYVLMIDKCDSQK